MLLAIDIGNSAIKFGVFDGRNLDAKFSFPTDRKADFNLLSSAVEANVSADIQRVIISSVVPELNAKIEYVARRLFGAPAEFVSYTSDLGLKIDYDTPETLGNDRLVNAFAAASLYGNPCIICSFGTATTIDAVSENAEYVGGIIAPGPQTMAGSLNQKTSQLPPVLVENVESVFGKSTVASIRAGIFFGSIALAEGIIGRMSAQLGEKAKVVATGGFAEFIADNTNAINVVDTDLLLKGLMLFAERRSQRP